MPKTSFNEPYITALVLVDMSKQTTVSVHLHSLMEKTGLKGPDHLLSFIVAEKVLSFFISYGVMASFSGSVQH